MIMPLACSITRPVTGSTAPMRLIYSTRSPATLLYATGLQRLATPGTGLDIDIACTREAPAGWSAPVGRLDDSIDGALRDVFSVGMTGATGRCAGCGNTGPFAEGRIFSHSPGLVLRCPACGEALLRLTRAPGRAWLDMRGLEYIELATPE